ncbi:alpha-N-acetylgalactosaminide alpha-2,6-sialyltransferase 6 isoform X1 [Ictidomys tridecemlineatus]
MPSVLRDSVSPSEVLVLVRREVLPVYTTGLRKVFVSALVTTGATEALTRPQTRVCPLSPFPSGAAVGRSHSRPEAPPTPRPGPGRRAAALGPGGRGLRRGLGGRSIADPGSRLPAPCEGLGGRGGGRSRAEEQRSAVFLILFALITILILYSSNSANEVFHYGSLRGRTRRPINLKKWSLTHGYIPILGNKTLPSRCHQCVIVTSSSHLLGTKLGPEIERAECTIRMNDAPTTGYSADVGNKTTFRVVAHSSVFRVLRRPQEFVNRTPETVFIFWGPPSKMQKPQGSLVRVIQRAGLAFPTMEAYAVSPARMQQFDDLFRGETGKDREKSHSWLSTGWFTMVIAVELCDHVHVYGMVPPDYCSQRPRLQRMPYHYYEPKGPDECVTYIQNEHSRKGNHHRFITEKRVFSSWAQLYGITFSHPSWT